MRHIRIAGWLTLVIVLATLVFDVPKLVSILNWSANRVNGFDDNYELWARAAESTYQLVLARETADPGEALVDEPLELKRLPDNFHTLEFTLNAAEPDYKVSVSCRYKLYWDHYKFISGDADTIGSLSINKRNLNEGPDWQKGDGVDRLGDRWCPGSTYSGGAP